MGEPSSDRNLVAVFEASPVGMLLCDAKGELRMANPALERIFGWEHGTLASQSVGVLVPMPMRAAHGAMVAGNVASARAHAIGAGREVQGTRRDGTIVPVEVSLTPISIGGERLVLGSVIDITERKRVEREVIVGQRLEAIGLLACGVAHDFNNLLTAIVSFTSFALEDLPAESSSREDLGEVLHAARRAADLSRQLLAFSGRHAVMRDCINVSLAVRSITKLLARVLGDDIELRTVLSPGTHTVWIDLGQLEQVLMNLAVNARDAMPQGGTLTIEASSEAGRVILSVADSGHGIPEHLLPRIFEPFFTTKEEGRGTGLGLATCASILREAGGTIAVESSASGTTFRISLPRSELPAGAAGPALPPGAVHVTGRVLLVEDAQSVRHALARGLTRAGLEVFESDSAKDAERVWQAHGGEIDVLVTDVILPRETGIDVAKRFRALRPELSVVLISGAAPERIEIPASLEATLLPKPFHVDDLVRAIATLLARRAASP